MYVDYSPSHDRYYIVIKNFGNSLGKVLHIETTPKLDWKKTRFNQDIEAITESNNFVLAPNQKISSWFDFKGYPDQKFDVEISYETLGKKHIENGIAQAVICNSGNANTCLILQEEDHEQNLRIRPLFAQRGQAGHQPPDTRT